MKVSILFTAALLALGSTSLKAQNSMLDLSFDQDGWTTTSLSTAADNGYGSVLQPDGKIVVAGTGNNTFSLVRYNPDGSLDTSFGTAGSVSTVIGGFDGAVAVALQPDGKLVAAGFSMSGTDMDFAMVRYQADGTPDTGFGTGGKVSTPFSTGGMDLARSIVLQPDGKIILAGQSTVNNIRNFAVMRYLADGTLDNSFGTAGKASPTFGTDDQNQVNAMALQTDGKIVLVGTAGNFNPGFHRVGLARLNSDGTLDTSFGTNGTITTASGGNGNDDLGAAVVLQPDGKILVAGDASIADHEFYLLRYNTDGTPDNSFGTAGQVHTHIGLENSRAAGLVLLPDGRFIAGGNAFDQVANLNFALVKYNADGSLDTGWGNSGIVTTDLNGIDAISSLLLQPDGKLVAAGITNAGAVSDFGVARYFTTSTLAAPATLEKAANLQLYPNPVSRQSTLEYQLAAPQSISVTLQDAVGRTLHTFINQRNQTAGSYRETLNVPAGLAAGRYTVVITTATSQTGYPLVVE